MPGWPESAGAVGASAFSGCSSGVPDGVIRARPWRKDVGLWGEASVVSWRESCT